MAHQGNRHQQQKQGGKKQAIAAMPVDPEMAAKLAKRAERFGVVSPTLEKVQLVQAQAEEVSER